MSESKLERKAMLMSKVLYIKVIIYNTSHLDKDASSDIAIGCLIRIIYYLR